jgi:hypothetical protein
VSIFNLLRGWAPGPARTAAPPQPPQQQSDELLAALEISDGDLEEAVGGLERIYAYDSMAGVLEKRA